MKTSLFAAAAIAFTLNMTVASAATDPIPGSITYNGQPKTKLVKAPIGSLLFHSFISSNGSTYNETYVIDKDRSLKLLNRTRSEGGR